MGIRAVLFDWDGTLAYEDGLNPQTPCEVAAAFAREVVGIQVETVALEAALESALPPYVPGQTLDAPRIDEVLTAAFERLHLRPDPAFIVECSRVIFEAGASGQHLYDDARALLPSLCMRGYGVGVVTNTIFPGHLMSVHLSRLGIAGYVHTLVASADVGLGKPHPAPYERALAQLGLQAHETVFVGDRVDTDIAGAVAAGIPALLLSRRGAVRDAAGVRVINRLSEVNQLLGEGTAR